MSLTRRRFITAAGLISLMHTRISWAQPSEARLTEYARSPWMINQVAVTSDKLLFLGAPRYARDKSTPSLIRRDPDGKLLPFPGNHWNEWEPGKEASEAFVYLNSVHIFDDDTVWCVDQGSLNPGVFTAEESILQPGGQKIVQFDARTGDVLRIIRFGVDILPPGAQMNDLRLHDSVLYISDSGLGGLIVHDLNSGRTLRRLSGQVVVRASDKKPPAILANIKGGKTFNPPQSDLIEITRDGKWLYWASPTGPLYRVATNYLSDPLVSDTKLLTFVENVFDNHFSGGCGMDSQGNIYFSETATHNITVLSPEGNFQTLVEDKRLNRPDGSFITRDRQLLIPEKVPVDTSAMPYVIFAVSLPGKLHGIRLGGSVSA